eukprot:1808502-Pyramimonas_sp.AAC.1
MSDVVVALVNESGCFGCIRARVVTACIVYNFYRIWCALAPVSESIPLRTLTSRGSLRSSPKPRFRTGTMLPVCTCIDTLFDVRSGMACPNHGRRDTLPEHLFRVRINDLGDVKHIKTQRHEGLPVDEITVYELIEPIERPADVSDMAEYMDINMETQSAIPLSTTSQSQLDPVGQSALFSVCTTRCDQLCGHDQRTLMRLPIGAGNPSVVDRQACRSGAAVR